MTEPTASEERGPIMTEDLLTDGPVERYLDELFDRLAGTGAAGRRSLVEAEDHLRSAAATGVATGLDRERAEREAVARFGSPGSIATALQLTHRGVGALIRPFIAGAFIIGVVGMLALGVSGIASELLGRTLGAAFVAGDKSGVTYTPARCADYFEYFPHASSCNDAAAQHHWGEVVEGRVAVGVLGLLGLGFGLIVRRALGSRWALWRPSTATVTLVIAAVAGAGAVVLAGPSAMNFLFGERSGIGVFLADGTVAGLVALGAAAWGLRHRRRTLRPSYLDSPQ
jgi:hypothetical protein